MFSSTQPDHNNYMMNFDLLSGFKYKLYKVKPRLDLHPTPSSITPPLFTTETIKTRVAHINYWTFFLTCSWFAQFYLQNPAFLLLPCCIDIFRLWKLLKSICFRIDFEVIPGGDIIGFAFFAVLKLMDHLVDFKNIKKNNISLI